MRVGRNPYLVTTRLFHTTRLLDSVEYMHKPGVILLQPLIKISFK